MRQDAEIGAVAAIGASVGGHDGGHCLGGFKGVTRDDTSGDDFRGDPLVMSK